MRILAVPSFVFSLKISLDSNSINCIPDFAPKTGFAGFHCPKSAIKDVFPEKSVPKGF